MFNQCLMGQYSLRPLIVLLEQELQNSALGEQPSDRAGSYYMSKPCDL